MYPHPRRPPYPSDYPTHDDKLTLPRLLLGVVFFAAWIGAIVIAFTNWSYP